MLSRSIWTLSLICCAAVAQAPASDVAAEVTQPPPGHVEFALVGSPGATLADDALARFVNAARAPGFLDTAAGSTADPLAPCALLAARLSADLLNRMFFGLTRPGGFDFRVPRATSILGLYDEDLARGRGAIPRDDPAKAADMLARSIVFRSWQVSTMLNTLILKLNQGQCLELLVHPERFDKMLGALKPADIVMTHAAPVSAYIQTVDRTQGQDWLAALPKPEMLEQRAGSGADNPLLPCALVPAFRLAARLNDAFVYALPAGKLDAADREELAPYTEALKKPLGAAGLDAKVAEVLGAVAAAEIRRSNWLSAQLVGRATQAECLDELFQPGGLRRNLARDGVTLPLR